MGNVVKVGLSPKYKKDIRNTIIGIVIYFVIAHLIPYSEPLTSMSMKLLGTFVMTIYLWSTVSTTWPSILAIFLLGCTGYTTGTNAGMQSFGHGMAWFVAIMLIFNVALTESGLSRRIATFFITRKFVQGKPWLIMFMFSFSVWFVSAFVTSSAVYAMFLSIEEEMMRLIDCDSDKGDDLPEALLCNMAWVDQVNQGSTPMSHTNVLLGMSLSLSLLGYEVSFLTVCWCGLLACFVQFLVIFLEFRFLQRPNVSKLTSYNVEDIKKTVPAMNKREKIVAASFIVLIFMWVSYEILLKIPFLAGLGALLKNIGTYGCPLLIVSALCIIPADGKPVLDIKDAMTKINWGAWLMMSALMGMATFLGKADYGVMPWLSEVFGGAMSNLGVSGTVFCALAIVIVGVLTNFMSNTASCSLINAFVPVACVIGGCNPLAMTMSIALICNDGFMVPSANPVMGVLCSMPNVRITYTMKFGFIASVLCIIVAVFIAYPIYSMVLPQILTMVG